MQSQYSIPQQYDYSMFHKILLLSASYSVITQCYVEFHNSEFYVILLLIQCYYSMLCGISQLKVLCNLITHTVLLLNAMWNFTTQSFM